MDYEPAGYREADLVKLEMLVNGEPVDAFSSIVHRDKAEARGRSLAAKLKEVILRSSIRSPFKRPSEEDHREKMSVPYARTSRRNAMAEILQEKKAIRKAKRKVRSG